jgi:hypothetical protein
MNSSTIIFREYNVDRDPEKIVKFLYTDFDSEEGIQSIINDDAIFRESPEDSARFVAEINGELHASLVLIRKKDNPENFTLHSLVTSVKMRQKGLANALFSMSKIWVTLQGGTCIESSTALDNVAAQKFFDANDFREVGKSTKEFLYELTLN